MVNNKQEKQMNVISADCKDAIDMLGREIKVGAKLAKGYSGGHADLHLIKIITVTRVENGKVYCDDSKQPLRFPPRTLIVTESV
jgi:hypothetical protein